MMTLDDSEKELNLQNRVDDGTTWCMAMAERGMKPDEGFSLRVGKRGMRLLTWQRLTREEHSELYTECRSRRCTLVQLPPGVSPKDLGIQGK